MWLVMGVKRVRLAAYIAWLGLKGSYEYRAAFWLQVGGMIINNSAVVVVVSLFYGQFGQVEGWGIKETMAAFGLTAIAFGSLQLMCSNILGSRLGERIVEGDLDSYLLFPQSALFHLAIRRIDISGVGDIVSGFTFMLLSGYLSSWLAFVLLPIGVALSMASLFGALLCAQSLTFWLPGLRGFGGLFNGVTTMSANWPPAAFNGVAKLFFFWLFPALFVIFLPLEVITHFRWLIFAGLAAFAVGVNILGRFVFARGLRRYESGNLMTTNI